MVGRNRKIWTGRLSNVALCMLLAAGLGACSTVDSWFGGDDGASTDAKAGPDLANLPAKSDGVPVDSQKLSNSLAADLKSAKHSAEILRGGTDAPAPPPPEAAPVPAPASVSAAASASTPAPVPAAAPAAAQTPAKADGAPAPVLKKDEPKDNSFTPPPSGKTIPGVLPDVSSIAKFGARFVVRPSRAGDTGLMDAGYVETAELPAGALPVTPADREGRRENQSDAVSAHATSVPAPALVPAQVQDAVPVAVSQRSVAKSHVPDVTASRTIDPADAALGFQPSSAPPLDPSITDFVPASIVQNYRNAAHDAGVALKSQRNITGGVLKPQRSAACDKGRKSRATNTVVSLASAPSAPSSGVPADVVVFFTDDSAQLDGKGASLVRKFAQAYRDSQGGVRVVGHASSRTKDMPVEKHFEVNRMISQMRATAVADALTRAGVPADKILVEAVSDSQPIYFESMPKGEDGNRRVEIFLQH